MALDSEFSKTPTKPFNMAIVGGGIAGLTLSLSLLSHGIPVTLYEAASKFGEIGAGVSFGPNATRAMELISPRVLEAFQARATYNQSSAKTTSWFDFRYGEDFGRSRKANEKITTVNCEGGQASVHRAHFLDELVKLLPNGIAKFGHRVVDYVDEGHEGIILRFANGEQSRHDAVIGCDGIKSKIRSCLLGADHPAARAVYSGKYAYRGLIPMDKAKALLGENLAQNSQMYLGNHGHVLTFPIEKGKTMNVVAFASSQSWDLDDWVVTMKRDDMDKDFATWGETVQSILSLMSKTDVWALFNHPEAPTFYKGRVALLGDAAHASTPHMGSGAGMAIEDVYIMGGLLGMVNDKHGIEDAFRVYNTLRKPRGTKLVVRSKEQGQLYDTELVGNDPGELKRELDSRMDWVWNHDITKDIEQGEQMLSKSKAIG